MAFLFSFLSIGKNLFQILYYINIRDIYNILEDEMKKILILVLIGMCSAIPIQADFQKINIEPAAEEVASVFTPIEVKVEEVIEEEFERVTLEISHYCACSYCCDIETGITASGTYATEGRTVAAPREIPFGSSIEFGGQEYIVEDRGGYIEYTPEGYMRLDVFISDHYRALEMGRYIIEGRLWRKE